MPNLEAQAAWVPVREIGIELARGGPNGNMNEQAIALLARTEWLNQQKASKSEIVQGHYEFNTYAEFNAIKSTLPLNCTVIINEMPMGTQTWGQGTNRWNGTTLSKSPYDPLAQAKADATTKANTAEANAKNYTDNATETKLLSGLDIYYKAQENPSTLFQAIWQEYNKPVYHIGNGTFVDVTGVTVVPYVVIPELVFKVKLTADNETFVFPTRNTTALPINMQIDWGDGTSSNHSAQIVDHTYSGVAGDEFTVRVTGSAIPYFDFSSNNARRTSRLMLNSIEKNTLPARSMEFFSIMGCNNIRYIGPEALQSFSGTTLFLGLASYQNVTFHKDAFKGLEHVTNINNLLGGTASDGLYTLPAGLFDYFVGVKFAQNLFRLINSPLPIGILDKIINLEDVTGILQGAKITSIDNRIFKNQKKLVNVTAALQGASSLVADAYQLYLDMNQGAPTTTKSCFLAVNAMTNLASVPNTWK